MNYNPNPNPNPNPNIALYDLALSLHLTLSLTQSLIRTAIALFEFAKAHINLASCLLVPGPEPVLQCP